MYQKLLGKALRVFALLAALAIVAMFASNPAHARQRGDWAVDACKGKSSGDAITAEGRRGRTVNAICLERDGELIAVPEGMLTPCNDKKEGDTVTFTGPRGHTVDATCKAVDSRLVAVPERFANRNKQ
ncbi:hypothetical protein [Oceanidesulfovibrio marinus]|uniref:DUF5666 domain-containing protein n=1 Tax=Oceanidesulfovibrio marinus TaxID=370038 RepID=A0A6P1ZKS5_9BACT|nr:hypothetical protein [Oceanidesulfovibrio marinus]TVM36551.1 hypothetical protein DQK91_01085 [Oceanidesulfovibrio marinus]